jgi:hypothetical protein
MFFFSVEEWRLSVLTTAAALLWRLKCDRGKSQELEAWDNS